MRINEIQPAKTPEQTRIKQLKANSKRASDAVKIEQNRQKMQRAQNAIKKVKSPVVKRPQSN